MFMMFEKISLAWPAILFLVLASSCSDRDADQVQTFYGYAMGTSYSVKMVSSLTEARNAQVAVEGILSDINARMSTYLPRSDLSNFAAVSVNDMIPVAQTTVNVVARSLQIAEATNGYFDPTVAPLVELWGFGPSSNAPAVPSDEAIRSQLNQLGYQAIIVDSEMQSLGKTDQRSLDLSAIAKGYAVDLVAEHLLVEGYDQFLVEVGGEMRVNGAKPDGSLWRIAIEAPNVDERKAIRIIEVGSGAIATSGDYRQFFEYQGKRFSHTINPHTGYPVDSALASVTVFAESAMDADAYATAFMAMGKINAIDFANENDIAAFFISRHGDDFEFDSSVKFADTFAEGVTAIQ